MNQKRSDSLMPAPDGDQPRTAEKRVEFMPSLETLNAGLTPARLPVAGGAAFLPAAPLPQVLSPMPNAVMLLRALQRRWLLALTAGLLCGLLASAIAWLALP